ncbi:hypothetical protein BJ742DRAFT_884769 [Cladochytrium replicatum]|nr:hypothetical protein BJ742DRAFT_884769 [Cladochytrium replicatum]
MENGLQQSGNQNPAAKFTSPFLQAPKETPKTNNSTNKIDEIENAMSTLIAHMQTLDCLHKSVLSSMGTEESSRSQGRLSAVQDEVDALFYRARTNMKELRQIRTDGDQGVFQQKLMAQKLQDIAVRYRELQTTYRSSYVKRIERQVRIVNPAATEEEIESASQGEDVTQIEARVEKAADDIAQSSSKLARTVEHRRSSGRMAWIICGIVTVVIIVIFILLWFYVISPIVNAVENGNTSSTSSIPSTSLASVVPKGKTIIATTTTSATDAPSAATANANVANAGNLRRVRRDGEEL